MNPPAPSFLVHGAAQAPAPLRRLRAGPVTLDYQDGDLRAVRLAGREVIRRIYGAVRDRNWGTVPAKISGLKSEVSDSAFRIGYVSEHRSGDLGFVWRAELTGDADGTLRFDFDGQATSTFLRNRIGLCVLHPIPEGTGARVRVLLTDGSFRDLTFPGVIAVEQPVRGFDTLAGLDHEILPGLWAEVRFSGETFETEDQRNWIDASFKTYGTPIRLPIPVEIREGERVHQAVEVRFRDERRRPGGRTRIIATNTVFSRTARIPLVRVSLPTTPWVPLPDLGLGGPSHRDFHDLAALKRLAILPLSHLRADVRPSDPGSSLGLTSLASDATELGLPLELAVCLDDFRGWASPGAWLKAVRSQLETARSDLTRILVFGMGDAKSTTGQALALAREHLGDLGVPIGAGTHRDLYQMNLQRPPADADFIVWSMNPQVHAQDTRSLMETPEAAAAQIASVRAYFPGMPLVVSPITLRPRCHPGVPPSDCSSAVSELPAAVDPRQMSLAGAAWTVAMLAALAPSGVESLTFFETSGWRGVMETQRGSPQPDRFPSLPGGVFPVWHVFAALSRFRTVTAGTVSDPGRVAALGLAGKTGRSRIILANLTPDPLEVDLNLVGARIRLLDEHTVAAACRDADAWWHAEPSTVTKLSLTAHAIAFIDLA